MILNRLLLKQFPRSSHHVSPLLSSFFLNHLLLKQFCKGFPSKVSVIMFHPFFLQRSPLLRFLHFCGRAEPDRIERSLSFAGRCPRFRWCSQHFMWDPQLLNDSFPFRLRSTTSTRSSTQAASRTTEHSSGDKS